MEFEIGDKVKIIGVQNRNNSLLNIIGTVISIYNDNFYGSVYEVGLEDCDVEKYKLTCNPKHFSGHMYNWKFCNDLDGRVNDKLQKIETQELYLI